MKTTDNFAEILIGSSGIEQKRLEKEPYKSPIEKDKIEGGVNSKIPLNPYSSKILINLSNKLILRDDLYNFNENIRATGGWYMIKYIPKGSRKYREGRPYQIGQDLIRWDIRVSGLKHRKALASKIPELKWLDENSTLTPFLFKIAKTHSGMSIFFTINWEKYGKMLLDQLEQARENPETAEKVQDTNLFGVHRSSFDEYKKDYHKCYVPQFKDSFSYSNDIAEAEKIPAVQEEMKEETGEVYIREKYLKRDPETGRFIKKEAVSDV